MKFSIISQINHFLLVILFYFEVIVSPFLILNGVFQKKKKYIYIYILNGVELKVGAVNNFQWFHQMIFLMVLI